MPKDSRHTHRRKSPPSVTLERDARGRYAEVKVPGRSGTHRGKAGRGRLALLFSRYEIRP